MGHRSFSFGVAAALALLVSVSGSAGPPTPRDDGKAFGELLRPQAAGNARTTPTPATVPNFVPGVPAESSYYSAPSTLAPAAAAAAPSSTGYATVTTSIASRPTFARVDLDATVARGKTVSADPMTYVAGYGATGTPGACVPLPPGGPSGATYEATCNTGYVEIPPVIRSCAITLTHQFNTANRYECSDYDWTGNRVDNCAIFDSSGCTRTGSRPGRCLQGTPSNCTEPGEPIVQLSCPVVVPGGRLLGTSTVYVGSTPDETACATWRTDGTCIADPDVCTDSTPTTRIVSGAPVTQPCWAWSRAYTCGGGVSPIPQNDCSSLEAMGCTFLREDCLTGPGPCMTTDRVYRCAVPAGPPDKTQFICDGDVYCLGGECDTILRTPNTEFKDAAVALNAASQAGKEFDPNNLTLFKGTRTTCGKAIFGFYNCCVPRGFPVLASCSATEKALAVNQKKGLCTYVGTYCSNKSFFGICLEKKEAHCCFLSKISRILQEQGRQQLGKPWGDPKTEKCLGFTITEFQSLDLSRMDFSEVYAEFTDAARLPAELATTTAMQTKITDYFNARMP